MRFVNFPIVGSFLVVLLLMVSWPKESNFGAPGKSVAQDVQATAEKNASVEKAPSSRFSPGTERTIKAEEALRHPRLQAQPIAQSQTETRLNESIAKP